MTEDTWPELNPSSLSYAESTLAAFCRDGIAVNDAWRTFLDVQDIGSCDSVERLPLTGAESSARLHCAFERLLNAYRMRGHRCAHIDPLNRAPKLNAELEPSFHGIGSSELDTTLVDWPADDSQRWTCGRAVRALRKAYCGSIGVQFMHIDDARIRQWIIDRMERVYVADSIDEEHRLRIARELTRAEFFERFLQKRFIGAKTFSLEGGESLNVAMSTIIDSSGSSDIGEIVIGMAHRGRLNVLANVVGKSLAAMMYELLDGDPAAHLGGGDIRYHLGACGVRRTDAGEDVRLSLCFNPSHLEYVCPVAMGRVLAKVHASKSDRGVLGVMIHGDAAVAGEGVVQETLNMSRLPGYDTGGSVHIVINNQIGFTTPPEQGRSSRYCTDIMRMIDIPIFHVNADDPDAVVRTAQMAMDFRAEFGRDVAIDLCGYRRHGHNEIDEPSFTQPRMYERIARHPTVRDRYLAQHRSNPGLSPERMQAYEEELREEFEHAYETAKSGDSQLQDDDGCAVNTRYIGGRESRALEVDTAVAKETLTAILNTLSEVPSDFALHPKLRGGLERRRMMASGEIDLDWASAEALAFGSLSMEGVPVRLSGQDSVRGTFGQRHLTWHDVETGATYTPSGHLHADQAALQLVNSPLSENSVLGFEYGYSLDRPEALVMWEAQFGDFFNSAQVIVDQFITSAEDKWDRLTGVVLLLPHGFEGQGPEHSSARLERFLLLAAEHNIQIVYPTTPAQYFHLLRRQVLRNWRKPLVVLTPKSLLRHGAAKSTLDQCADGRFHRVLEDGRLKSDGAACRRVLLCSGKIYYDLAEQREGDSESNDCAIVRIEQLYPFPFDELEAALAVVPDGAELKWVQEEPENMGAWRYMQSQREHAVFERFDRLGLVARLESASPATGSKSAHKLEQNQLIKRAMNSGNS